MNKSSSFTNKIKIKMSKGITREDKTCLNCNHVVEKRFCPNCGQENVTTRKTFYLLFVHFFEDLTHYENAFWKTIKNLLIKPSSLTKEYLSGKRMSYLAPIRLYIFLSFVTFFTIAITSSEEDDLINYKKEGKSTPLSEIEIRKEIEKELSPFYKMERKGLVEKKFIDSLRTTLIEARRKNKDKDSGFFILGYNSMKQLDSTLNSKKKTFYEWEYNLIKKSILINEKYTNEEIQEKLGDNMFRNFPKVLFLYMPIFAFLLWLFHNKKKWYYFDHGIFTLHYFSFLLLIFLLIYMLTLFSNYFDNTFINILFGIFIVIGVIWMIYYFYPAHHRFYGCSRIRSFFFSSLFLFLNIILISISLTLLFIYSFLSIH